MNQHLGDGYAQVWSRQQVLAELDGRTVEQALASGVPPKRVWRAVWAVLGLPASER